MNKASSSGFRQARAFDFEIPWNEHVFNKSLVDNGACYCDWAADIGELVMQRLVRVDVCILSFSLSCSVPVLV